MNFIFQKLTLDDKADFRRVINRRAGELMLCLRAGDAEWMLDFLASCSDIEISRLCAGEDLTDTSGEDLAVFRTLKNLLLDKKSAMEKDRGESVTSDVVRRGLKEKLLEEVADGGDYETFLCYMEFVLRRHDDPDLKWEIFRTGIDGLATRRFIMERLYPQVEGFNEGAPSLAPKPSDP